MWLAFASSPKLRLRAGAGGLEFRQNFRTWLERQFMKKTVHRNLGFTLVEIMIVVGIIGMLVAIALPNFIKSRATSQQNACINNLRQINSAVQQWAMENNQPAGAPPPDMQVDLTPYIQLNSNSSIPDCPAGGTYTLYNISAVPQVSCSLSTLPSNPHIFQ
jgi:prepilin-type N-terminal cleavage/methylation domain-containing protein